MPTKHKRKRDHDRADFDLPPSSKAKSLPVIAPTKDFLAPRKKQKLTDGKGKKVKNVDDTPKSFARLMAWHQGGKRIGGGLDNSSQPVKKRKKQQAQQDVAVEATVFTESANAAPKILPGESLAEYGVRVDQSLPLSSLPKTNVNPNSTLPEDLREKEKKSKVLTKHNKRLARMQSEWRNTEAKLKAKEEEEMENNEEKLEEEKLLWDEVRTTGKKGKRKVVEDDPWKVLEKKRREEGPPAATAGLTARDQAQAPPMLGAVKNMFKERQGVVSKPQNKNALVSMNGGPTIASKARYKHVAEQAKRDHVQAAMNRRSMQV